MRGDDEFLLYRIVKTNPPTLADFFSDAARGRPLPLDPSLNWLHDGLSMFATESQAIRKAQQYPVLGGFIAEIGFPATSSVKFERTIPRSQGHHTVWAEPELLLRYVRSVRPVHVDREAPQR